MEIRKTVFPTLSLLAIVGGMTQPPCHAYEPPTMPAWTWLYQKYFTLQEQTQTEHHTTICFSKNNIHPFTQLIFSWNSVRPHQGYFSFWVQAHSTKGSWGPWHKMVDWGAHLQKSYTGGHAAHQHYAHVRLEMEDQTTADGFRLKIESHDGAPLSCMKSLFVVVSDLDKFQSESSLGQHCTLPSVRISRIPTLSQMTLDHPRNIHLCSPTSCSMLLSFLTNTTVDPLAFAHACYDAGLDAYGSWPFNVAAAYEYVHTHDTTLSDNQSPEFSRSPQPDQPPFSCAVVRLPSFVSLHRSLMRGKPVVVSVRGFLPGAPKVYIHGHLLLVIGFDKQHKRVICHDPAFPTEQETLVRYPLKDFLQAWERSHRLAYVTDVFLHAQEQPLS